MGVCTIRSYRDGDREALVLLWSTVFPDDPPRNEPNAMIANKMRVQPELLLVAEDEGRLVGAAMAGFDGTRGWIHHVAVDPTRRRRGIGGSLIEAAVEGLRALGCPKVNLQVRTQNSEVVAFYQALGFELEDRICMGKLLLRPATGAPR